MQPGKRYRVKLRFTGCSHPTDWRENEAECLFRYLDLEGRYLLRFESGFTGIYHSEEIEVLKELPIENQKIH